MKNSKKNLRACAKIMMDLCILYIMCRLSFLKKIVMPIYRRPSDCDLPFTANRN